MAMTTTVSMCRKRLGAFLKSKRQSAGLTQWFVAEQLGYSTPQFVSNWGRGLSIPPVHTLPALARFYAVSQSDMIAEMHRYQAEVMEAEQREVVDAFRQAG
jgi:transcriptional regulator with XRE-family HTH domain